MFELEKAIKKWRKDLYKNEAFEDMLRSWNLIPH